MTSTMTTDGFSDIAPITTKARMVVSTEETLGILLIGLSLNSLARRRSE
jgi:hypothetical protein